MLIFRKIIFVFLTNGSRVTIFSIRWRVTEGGMNWSDKNNLRRHYRNLVTLKKFPLVGKAVFSHRF